MPTGFLVPEGAGLTHTFTGVVPTTGWTASDNGHYIDVSVAGLLATDTPFVDIDCDAADTMGAAVSMMKQFTRVWKIVPTNGKARVYATSVPTVSLRLRFVVVR